MSPQAVAEAENVAEAAGNGGEPLTRGQKMAVARCARAFGQYGEARKAMAAIAKSIVSLRLTFEKDGRPDFRGETPQYRGAIASLYEAAIPDPEERSSFKVAIRYWVGKEFAAQVESKKLKADDLIAAGAMAEPRTETPGEPQEPRRAGTPATTTKTGIMAGDEELTPADVLVEAERIVTQHVTDESLGVVMALQSIGRELGPVVAALRDETVRDGLPGRALKSAVEHLLNLTVDAAVLCDIDVDEHVASWFASRTGETVAA